VSGLDLGQGLDGLGEILDVVHLQDRASGIGDVLRLARAARVLAVPFAAQQHGTARRLQAQNVGAHSRLAEPGATIASTGPDPAQAPVLLFQPTARPGSAICPLPPGAWESNWSTT
jgi:hypothetical protein